jgi:hypothetical protein
LFATYSITTAIKAKRREKSRLFNQPSRRDTATSSTTQHVVKHSHPYPHPHQQHHAVSTNPIRIRAIRPFPHPIRRYTAPESNTSLPVFLHTVDSFSTLYSVYLVWYITDQNQRTTFIATLVTTTNTTTATAPELHRHATITTTKIHV